MVMPVSGSDASSGRPGRPPQAAGDRQQRLAAALRDNLRRRKAQVRGRADQQQDPPPGKDHGPGEP